MSALWVAGFLICIFGCFLASVGLAMQKLTHTRRQDSKAVKDSLDPSKEEVSYFNEPLWLLGMAFIVVDAILGDYVTSNR